MAPCLMLMAAGEQLGRPGLCRRARDQRRRAPDRADRGAGRARRGAGMGWRLDRQCHRLRRSVVGHDRRTTAGRGAVRLRCASWPSCATHTKASPCCASKGDGLFVRLSVDGLGHVFVQGHVTDAASPSAGNALVFALRGARPRRARARRGTGPHGRDRARRARTALDGAVEVRSRFDGTWVPGFEIAELLHLDDAAPRAPAPELRRRRAAQVVRPRRGPPARHAPDDSRGRIGDRSSSP